ASVATHGISQTLFHGLGTVPNPWGIQWSDAYGYQYVHARNPSVGYLTPAYVQILRQRYWQIVREQPLQVLRIYAIKFRETINFPFRVVGIPFKWALLFSILLWPILFYFSQPQDRYRLQSALGILVFLILFLGQGVLGIPWGNHLYPV